MKISRFNTKIMALTLIVILCSNLLCGVILIRFINQTLHSQIIEDNDRMIGETTNRFDAYVDDISTFGKVLSMDQQMQLLLRQTDTVLNTYPYFHDVQDLSEQLKRFTLMMENYVEDIYIVRDGNLPIVSGKNLLSYQDSVRESWYQEFLASQKWRAFSTEVQTIRSQNNRDVEVFHYLQNIYDLQNPKEKLGTLVVVLKCTPIQNMLETESAGEVSYLLLRGGEALYPQEFPLEGASIRSSLAVKSQLQENWVDNGQYYFSRSIGKTDWTLIEILPADLEDDFAFNFIAGWNTGRCVYRIFGGHVPHYASVESFGSRN